MKAITNKKLGGRKILTFFKNSFYLVFGMEGSKLLIV